MIIPYKVNKFLRYNITTLRAIKRGFYICEIDLKDLSKNESGRTIKKESKN
jgi:hypothetical protein